MTDHNIQSLLFFQQGHLTSLLQCASGSFEELDEAYGRFSDFVAESYEETDEGYPDEELHNLAASRHSISEARGKIIDEVYRQLDRTGNAVDELFSGNEPSLLDLGINPDAMDNLEDAVNLFGSAVIRLSDDVDGMFDHFTTHADDYVSGSSQALDEIGVSVDHLKMAYSICGNSVSVLKHNNNQIEKIRADRAN